MLWSSDANSANSTMCEGMVYVSLPVPLLTEMWESISSDSAFQILFTRCLNTNGFVK